MFSRALSVVSVMVLFLACGDDSKTSENIDVSFNNLKAASVIKGSTTLELNVNGTPQTIEVLANDTVIATLTKAPWSFDWDSTQYDDDLYQLNTRIDGVDSDNDSLPVVVLNSGEEATWDDGNTGSVNCPDTGYVDEHIKHHWTISADEVKKVITVLRWDNPTFKLELAVGIGTCPHSGETATLAVSQTSPIVLSYPEGESNSALAAGMWFAHVQPMNPTEILGQTTNFEIRTFLLK